MVSKTMQLIAQRHQKEGFIKQGSTLAERLETKCAEILDSPLSQKSITQYRRTGARLDKLRGESLQAVDITPYANVRSTYYSYRTSVRFHAAEQGRIALADRLGATSTADLRHAEARMARYMADLEAYPVEHSLVRGLLQVNLARLGLEDPIVGLPHQTEQKKTRGSKLKDMKKIAKKYPDWRSLIWTRLVEMNSHWLTYVAIAALTGARPEELGNVTYTKKDGKLFVRVIGAKVSDTKGQPWRTFTIENDGSLEYTYLFNQSDDTVKTTEPLTRKHADAFSAALSRAGATTMPDAPRMSGYVYRHAFASDMKRAGLPRQVIAAALGHAVTKTQDAYGRALVSTGSRSVTIDCARQVRITHDVDMFTVLGSRSKGMSLSVLEELRDQFDEVPVWEDDPQPTP